MNFSEIHYILPITGMTYSLKSNIFIKKGAAGLGNVDLLVASAKIQTISKKL